MSYVGTVKGFNPEKGWGHIECAETHEYYGKDVFLLKGQLQGTSFVAKGDKVAFQLTDNGRGPEATDVKVVSSAGKGATGASIGPAPGGNIPGNAVQLASGSQFGTVKSYNPEKGWGHIECAQTHAMYGKDIFFMKSQLPGGMISQGTPVQFSVMQGIKGPEAMNIQPLGVGAGAGGVGTGLALTVGLPQVGSVVGGGSAGQVHYGTIKAFNEEKGWGHIICPQTQALYGKDIFVMRSALNGSIVAAGEKVQFGVTMGMKGPEAINVKVMVADCGRSFSGNIKLFNEEKGYGFIDCSETRQLYGKDIFIHKKDLGSHSPKVGDTVHFSVQISPEGRPEGTSISFGPGASYEPYKGGHIYPQRSSPF